MNLKSEDILKEFYFSGFEDRQPYKAIADSKPRTILFQFFGITTIVIGLAYVHWRWMYSLNTKALWFAIPLVIAETLSFIGTILMIFNYWANKDPDKQTPPHYLSDIEDLNGRQDRPIRIDVFITTYNEDVELVRYSIRDAKLMTYPFDDVEIKIYTLDDGRRDGRTQGKENMKAICQEEGVGYFCRPNNEGYKAGNLKNGLEQTKGDIFMILDADTRAFPQFLENTSGYFRNKKLAWVQTPQWFYDITDGKSMNTIINTNLKIKDVRLNQFIDKLFGKIMVGQDIFGNNPRLFYDVILRRRNNYNAAFCCGAGSIHRREAIMNLAVRDFANEVEKKTLKTLKKEKSNNTVEEGTIHRKRFLLAQEVKPFKFHASEDIYTSMLLHSSGQKWESLQHPNVECKMLSPQDLDSCIKQRIRYASGSLDIAIKDNPLFKSGLTLAQRLSYFNTIWSYFAPMWLIVFLLSPIVFFFTQTLPVTAFSFDFFKYFILFQVFNTVTITLGSWGIFTGRGEQYYIASFWLMVISLNSAFRGKKVKFNVTPKDKQFNTENIQHIYPHIIIIGLTILGIFYNIILILMHQHPSLSGFVSNTFWSLFNIYNLSIIIRAAFWKEEEQKNDETLAMA